MLSAMGLLRKIGSARYLGLSILLAAPFGLSASTVTVTFDATLNGLPGVGTFVYDSTETAGGPTSGYADAGDGLQSFSFMYDGVDYTDTSASLLDGPTAPTVFLPGNTTIEHGLQYEAFGFWVVSGSCTGTGLAGDYNCTGPGGSATILGMSRDSEVFLASDVTTADFSFSGDSLHYNLGPPTPPIVLGTITSESAVVTPEPATFTLMALGLAGLFLVRRKLVL
jgi:hypothetical protein